MAYFEKIVVTRLRNSNGILIHMVLLKWFVIYWTCYK